MPGSRRDDDAAGKPPDPWASTSWEGARMATLLECARMTLAEKLEWLEEASKLADRLQASRERRLAAGDAKDHANK